MNLPTSIKALHRLWQAERQRYEDRIDALETENKYLRDDRDRLLHTLCTIPTESPPAAKEER